MIVREEQKRSRKELGSPLTFLSYVKAKSVVKGKGNIEKGKEKSLTPRTKEAPS